MKHTLIFAIIYICSLPLLCQEEFHCATDKVMNEYYNKHPELKHKKHQEDINQSSKIKNNQHISSASFTIPVVFHILHIGGPENISDEQVRDGLRILNRDFAKQNPDTNQIIPSMKTLADSMQIQFELATLDPNGNCTNGIMHYYDTDTDWDDTSPTLYSHSWNSTKYLNVYIVRTITLSGGFGAAGYTYFPGTFGPGDPMDAIVVLNNYFAAIGTGSNFTSRVLTHEVGHWLNLYHVFGGSNGAGIDCFNDDFISDTPQTAGFLSCPDANDPSTYQLCSVGVDENFQNYMDYSYCLRMFTQEQGAAMRFSLLSTNGGRDNLSTPSNLLATGVSNPTTTCIPIAEFIYNREKVCVGKPVTFTDASQNGTPTTYTWTLTGATPASSNALSPSVIYAAPGLYSVTYSSGNSAGNASPITKTNIITVINNTSQYQNNYTEGFEADVFSNQEWNEYSSSGGSHWVYTSDAAYSGVSSAMIPHLTNTRNMKTSMESPSIDLTTFTSPLLTYKFTSQETNPAHVNCLRVYITTDCGQNWNLIDSIGGMDLATAGIGPSPYIPIDISEWAQRTINLNSYSNSNFSYLKFIYTRDTISAANRIYIDDINIASSIGINQTNNNAELNTYPNPSNGQLYIDLKGIKANNSKISIVDVLGREIYKETIRTNESLININLDVEQGIYFVKITKTGNTTVLTKKIIIQK
jgi:hypothetical protein